MARMGTSWQRHDARTPIEGPPSTSGSTSVAGSSAGSATMAKGILALDIINSGVQAYMGVVQLWDNKKIEKYTNIAEKLPMT